MSQLTPWERMTPAEIYDWVAYGARRLDLGTLVRCVEEYPFCCPAWILPVGTPDMARVMGSPKRRCV